MIKASISIFAHEINYPDKRNCPITPPEVFSAALRIIESKGCELIRTKDGMYVVSYSETGPSNRREGWSGWLPVYVARIQTWSSGGIKQNEMEAYLSQNENTHEAR